MSAEKTFILPHGRAGLLAHLEQRHGDRLTVEVKPYRPHRSLEQNALSHVWYQQIGQHMGETPAYVRRFCKLNFGVPILRADSAGYNKFCERALDGLDYEEQIEAMKYVPVTRLMKKGQMVQYIESVQIHFAQQGVLLEAA